MRGASNPDGRTAALDCFASLAMTDSELAHLFLRVAVTVFSGFPPVSTCRARAAFVEPGSEDHILERHNSWAAGDRRADRRSCEPRRFRRRDRGARGRDGKSGVGGEMAPQRLEKIESA